ncbi:MAG: glycosyl hydrolase, partial [Bacteroidota bacterium]
AVHHYGGPNVLNFVNKLKETYETYNRPIWVTEFAVADWNATSPQNNKHSEAAVTAFMNDALAALDDIDWIYRYTWFDGSNAALYTSSIFDDDANITPLGEVYAAHNPNLEIGPGVDTEFEPEVDPNELLINGGFETGEIAPWKGFKNGVVGPATTAPHTGNFCGRIENGDGSLFYVADVEPGTTYTLSFYSKWLEASDNTFSGKLRNNEGNALIESLPDMPQTDQWEETTYDFTVPDGVTQLKMVFFKGKGFAPFFMDDVSLQVKEE